MKSQEGCFPYHNTLYSPYDPKLSISGTQFRSLFPHEREQKHGGTVIADFSESHFKFLGRLMCPDMTSYCTIEKLTEQYWIWMNRIDKNQVYGPGKLWIYEIGILNKLTWPFFTYDYTITFAKRLGS